MYHVLAPHEFIEDFRSRLEEAIHRPVFVCGSAQKTGTHYKFPGETDYRAGVNPLDLFLSTLKEGVCVRREGNDFYFDLEESPTLYLVYPYLKGDDPLKSEFSRVGLRGSWSTQVVLLSSEAEAPAPLRPYLTTLRDQKKRTALRFHSSQPIQAPLETRFTWHEGVTAEKEGFTVIQPPGRYSFNSTIIEDFSTMGIVVASPGPCVICRGKKGESVHLVALHEVATGPKGHICRGCARDTFNQWLDLMDQKSS